MRTVFEYTTQPGNAYWPTVTIHGEDSHFFASIECEIRTEFLDTFLYYFTSTKASPQAAIVELLLDFLQEKFKNAAGLPDLLNDIILPAMLKYQRG